MPATPHLVKWDRDLRDKGLRILAVYAKGREDNLDKVREVVRANGIAYPILFDAQGANLKTYAIQGMPVAYLVDVEGNVAWEGILLKNKTTVKDGFEDALRKELARVKRK